MEASGQLQALGRFTSGENVLGGTQSQSGQFGSEKNLSPSGNRTTTPQLSGP
jgi:hypothetical protein